MQLLGKDAHELLRPRVELVHAPRQGAVLGQEIRHRLLDESNVALLLLIRRGQVQLGVDPVRDHEVAVHSGVWGGGTCSPGGQDAKGSGDA